MAWIDNGESGASIRAKLNALYATVSALGSGGGSVAPSISVGVDVTHNEGAAGGTTTYDYTVAYSAGTTVTDRVVTVTGAGYGSNPADAADFQGSALPSGSHTFSGATASWTFSATVKGDATVEPDEQFQMTFSLAGGNTVTARGTITNDDAASSAATVAGITQQSAANRIYQRDTTAGGGQGKGQGTIQQQVNVTTAGTLYARCRSAADGTTIVQAAWLAINTAATGNTVRDIPGVDARPGWFYLDISGDGATWIDGTVPIGMGLLGVLAGQSLVVREFRAYSSEDTTTIAGAGVTINPNGRIFASADAGNGGVPTDWTQASDAGPFNGAGAPELIARLIALAGVNVGLVGRGEGGTTIAQWQPGTTYGDALLATMQAAGSKFEFVIWYQGHSDGQDSAVARTYATKLGTLFAALASNNTFTNPVRLVSTVGTLASTGFGVETIEYIRGVASDWCASNGATYVPLPDIQLGSDNTHALQTGSVRTARHFYRALRPHFGAAHDDKGAVIGTPTHAAGSKDFVLPFALPVGATALSAIGSPATRFNIFKRGRRNAALALDGATPLTIDNIAKTITLKTADNQPAAAYDILFAAVPDPVADGSASLLVDDLVDGDGLSQGRVLYASPRPARVTISQDLVLAGSPAYGPGKFGNTLTAGYGDTRSQILPSLAEGWRVEFFAKITATDGNLHLFCGSSGRIWIGVQNNDLRYQIGNSSSQTVSNVFSGAGWHHIAFNFFAPYSGQYELVIDGVSQGFASGGGFDGDEVFGIRSFGGGSFVLNAGQDVDEVAIWRETWPAGMPSAPYSGNEAGLIELWHLNNDGLNSAAAA